MVTTSIDMGNIAFVHVESSEILDKIEEQQECYIREGDSQAIIFDSTFFEQEENNLNWFVNLLEIQDEENMVRKITDSDYIMVYF